MSISGLLLSQPVPVKGLVVRYTTNYLIGRSPILRHRSSMLEEPLATMPFQVMVAIEDYTQFPGGILVLRAG